MEKLVVTNSDLAEGLGITPQTILQHRSGGKRVELLIGLPEAIQKRPKLLWLRADIDAWLKSRQTFVGPEDNDSERRRSAGRPRKRVKSESNIEQSRSPASRVRGAGHD